MGFVFRFGGQDLVRPDQLGREFESVMQNSPLDLAYEVVDGEERYRSVGITDSGRLLVVIWTLRDGKVRAVTAFPASAPYKKLFPARKP